MSPRREIHLINPLWSSAGGSESRTVELFRELSPHADVFLWSEGAHDPDFARVYPIRQIDDAAGSFPRGGTLVFVGVYRLPGLWIAEAQPRRAIVIYNTQSPRVLLRFMRHLFDQGISNVEIVYASELLQQETKLRGVVEPSFIDLNRFAMPSPVRRNSQSFTVGRLSRDDPRKHHAEDVATYQRLVESGCRVRIMGGTCLSAQCLATQCLATPFLASACPASAGIELLLPKAESAEAFLHSLDCFFYRTSLEWWESFGRVIHEAMACGLPVVCQRRGGYVTSIDHGRTGFLFDTTDEALAIIHSLRNDPSLRASIATSARAAMETMYSPAARAKIIDYYLL